ncbi:hypothetical protein [Natronomonas marina]|jgi:hypothetical protein|uniref:hypothetical protein n=1 Tax=Natronomonas marina TaxID=2961939 RepID=UPI0020C9C37A|nr:hypothetical protein [Natronomonas marina]
MSRPVRILSGLLRTVATFLVLILLAIVAFYVTVFVVSTGAELAGYDPSGDFVVLSAALLVIAALFGGLPIARRPPEDPETGDQGYGFQ